LVTPYDQSGPGSGPAAAALRSNNDHSALVLVNIKDRLSTAEDYYQTLRDEVHSSRLNILATGDLAVTVASTKTLQSDLARAQSVSLPLSLILLLLVFGALVAASLPIGVGILTVIGGVGGTLLLAHVTDVSSYAIDIVALIGLGVAIDYSLFLVNRFREELAAGADTEDAVVRSVATSGRAIVFSGVTVAVGLSGLLFFRGTFLASMGAAGAISVGLAVLYGLSFLPALLSVLGSSVNRLRVLHVFSRRPTTHVTAFGARSPFWRGIAEWVMQRPILVLGPALAFLVLAGIPFTHLQMATGDTRGLPATIEARQGYDLLVANFPGQNQTTFDVVAYYPSGNPLTADRVADLYRLTHQIAAVKGILRVDSIFNLDPALTVSDYQNMYVNESPSTLSGTIRSALASSVGPHIVVVEAFSNQVESSPAARNQLSSIRDLTLSGGGQVLVTGVTAFDVDIINYILRVAPYAFGFVLAVTYLVLFLLTGSVVLPLKAVIMNLLSISASFGALVWIFQDGHLSGLLGFTPQAIDPSVPPILFAIVFGLSMDYEVIMVSRIQEEYRRTHDNRSAVATGLERTGRLITSAALIMIIVFLAFGLAQAVVIKAIGLGLAVAVAVDATIVRALVVPAVMRLLGKYNWWAPRPLSWLHERIHLSDEIPSSGESAGSG
jgi:RND superfamily putative drug exporter